MFYFGIILAIHLFGIVNLSAGTNYCDPALCESDNQVKQHIGCDNYGEFSSYCERPSLIPMTAQMMNTILFTHNDLRNKVANGTLPRFQSAKRMTTLAWDSELAFLAELNVRQCELKHDECHNTEIYKFSGQNLAIHSQSVRISSTEYQSIVELLINKWFDENNEANQEDVDKCSDNSLLRGIGHFTEMIHEKTSKIGCSIVTYFEYMNQRNWNTLLMACNYSFGNLIGWPIYVKGPMCSGCQTGCNPVFNGLCSISENVPPVLDMNEIISPIALPRSTQPESSHQSNPPIPLPRTIKSTPSGVVSIAPNFTPSRSIDSISSPQTVQTDQAAGIISIVPSARTVSLVGQPRSTQSLIAAHIPLGRSVVPVPSPRLSLVPSQHSIVPVEPPVINNLETTPVPPRQRHSPSPRPNRQGNFAQTSRRDGNSHYSEIFRPLLPIPRAMVLLGQAIKSIITWFIIP